MRLVSVVVPLWLMATTSVSLMSSSSPKPESSVAAIASAVRCDPTNRRERGGELWPAIGGGALPDHDDTADRAGAEAVAQVLRERLGDRATTLSGRRGSTILPRSVLRNDAGASEISFRRKCGKSPRSMSRVVISACWSSSLVSGSGVPSNAVRLMPSRVPACSASSTTTCPRVADERSGSAGVSPSIRRYVERLLDEAVRLARDHERVFGEPDVEGLPTAAQRQEELVGRGGHLGADRQRSLERGDGGAERLVDGSSPRAMRRDTSAGITLASVVISGGNSQALERLEVGVVVDVAVERADHVGRGRGGRAPPG